MIRYTEGNLIEAQTEALVNTVNEVGVMGKGIALMFKEAFSENTAAYVRACRSGQVRVGTMFVTFNPTLIGPRWIVNFPTKKHWRNPSRMEWIRDGLQDLVRVVRAEGIQSIAIPPLGCGNGGLEWSDVREEIERAFAAVSDVEVVIYQPVSAYQNTRKPVGAEQLTPARALIAETVRRYLVLGIDCTNLEIQKLAWFLQRTILAYKLDDPLGLNFIAHRYGPYDANLRHLLNNLDGSYLHFEKRVGDSGPFDRVWFDDSRRAAVDAYLRSAEACRYLPALERTARIIDGFESPLGMELLATVDWLLYRDGCEPTVTAIRSALERWPGGRDAAKRKLEQFDDRLLTLALDRLVSVNPGSVA